jgi:hypothetical protein
VTVIAFKKLSIPNDFLLSYERKFVPSLSSVLVSLLLKSLKSKIFTHFTIQVPTKEPTLVSRAESPILLKEVLKQIKVRPFDPFQSRRSSSRSRWGPFPMEDVLKQIKMRPIPIKEVLKQIKVRPFPIKDVLRRSRWGPFQSKRPSADQDETLFIQKRPSADQGETLSNQRGHQQIKVRPFPIKEALSRSRWDPFQSKRPSADQGETLSNQGCPQQIKVRPFSNRGGPHADQGEALFQSRRFSSRSRWDPF